MLTLAVAAVLWVVVAAHLVRGWRAMPRLDAILALLATAMTIKALMALSLLEGVTPRILTIAAAAGAGVVAVELLRQLAAEGRATSRILTWALRAAAAAYVAAATVLTLAGASRGEVGRAAGGEQVVYDSAAIMAALYCLSGACLAGVTAWMVCLLVRLVRISPHGPIRHALTLTAFGVTALVGYELLWLLQGVLGPTDLTAPWATAGILIFKAGVVVIGWAYLRTTFIRSQLLGRWRDRRALTELEPLWRQLEPLDPAVTLLGYPTQPRLLRGPALELALWRTMVEIREWLDVIAARVSPGTHRSAVALAEQRHGAGRRSNQLAELAWIQLGLHAGRGTNTTPDDRPRVGRDVDEELSLLLALVPRAGDRVEVNALRAAVNASLADQTRREVDISGP